MCLMSKWDIVTEKAIHQKLKGSGKWMDMRRFVKPNIQPNPNSLFELFGSFSSQTADDI